MKYATPAHTLVRLDSRQTRVIAQIIESLSKAHTDLSELCSVVCTTGSPCLSQNAYEECNLALAFLSALIITMWATGNPPAMRPLEWRESIIIYAVLFSTMHRLENAFHTLKQELYAGSV